MAEKTTDKIRVRMAPSPTGQLHIGTAWISLFNWLFARKNGATFVLRIEDTDKERSKKEYEQELLEGLAWLGIDWDEGPIVGSGKYKGDYGPYRQSERTAIYRKYLEKLLASGDAYYCYCTKEELEAQKQSLLASGLPPKYNGHCRIYANDGTDRTRAVQRPVDREPQVIRFKVPEVRVEFKDIIRGKVSFDAALLGDQVIARNLDAPLYNFAVVVDDEEMKISHVIRAEDHLSNTPKQILFQRALGFREPVYAHVPLILNPDRSKMSKRFADTALSEYRAQGYLPDSIINFLALMGWHPKDDRELLNRDELISEFELERVQKAGAVFNQEKLDWFNREYMKNYSDAELAAMVKPYMERKYAGGLFGDQSAGSTGSAGNRASDPDFIKRLVSVERSRANTLADFAEVGAFFFKLPDYDAKLLIWKESPMYEVAQILEEAFAAIEKIDVASFTRETLAASVSFIIGEDSSPTKRNRGTVLWPLRVALSGLGSSPDPIDIMVVLGKDESLVRIRIAIDKLKT